MNQSQTWSQKDHLQHSRALSKACSLERFLNCWENGLCQNRIPEGAALTLKLPWGWWYLGLPQAYNEHKQPGLIWEAEEGPGQPGQSQKNMDKQQKWLEALTSSGFSHSVPVGCFIQQGKGANPTPDIFKGSFL